MPIRPNSNPNMEVRHPHFLPPDIKILQMNKRMQERPENGDIQWWDMFVTEFFEDKCILTLSFFLEDGPKSYSIGRALVPRFFKTMFENDVIDVNLQLIHPKDFHNSATNSFTLECSIANMIMHHAKLVPTKVFVEGHFAAEFSADELMRMRSFHFTIRNHVEFIPKQAPMQNPAMLDDLCKNVTRVGLTSSLLNFLKMCVILEPMKELMSRQKTYNMDPRDCLRNCLFQKWSRMLNPPADTTRPNKRITRKRKPSSITNASNASQGQKKKPFSSSDVMMVGEPTLMGSEFGDEDERTIQRLENNQFDGQMHVKSEDRDAAQTFPSSIASPITTQWQHQPNATTMQSNAAINPKSEPNETPAEQTTPLSTSS